MDHRLVENSRSLDVFFTPSATFPEPRMRSSSTTISSSVHFVWNRFNPKNKGIRKPQPNPDHPPRSNPSPQTKLKQTKLKQSKRNQTNQTKPNKPNQPRKHMKTPAHLTSSIFTQLRPLTKLFLWQLQDARHRIELGEVQFLGPADSKEGPGRHPQENWHSAEGSKKRFFGGFEVFKNFQKALKYLKTSKKYSFATSGLRIVEQNDSEWWFLVSQDVPLVLSLWISYDFPMVFEVFGLIFLRCDSFSVVLLPVFPVDRLLRLRTHAVWAWQKAAYLPSLHYPQQPLHCETAGFGRPKLDPLTTEVNRNIVSTMKHTPHAQIQNDVQKKTNTLSLKKTMTWPHLLSRVAASCRSRKRSLVRSSCPTCSQDWQCFPRFLKPIPSNTFPWSISSSGFWKHTGKDWKKSMRNVVHWKSLPCTKRDNKFQNSHQGFYMKRTTL